jgi:hypothetical protein
MKIIILGHTAHFVVGPPGSRYRDGSRCRRCISHRHHVDSIDTFDLSAPHISHINDGTSMVSFQDRPWVPSMHEAPARTFQLVCEAAPGNASILSSYVSPSPSGISMRSATGQIVRPKEEGRLPFAINTDTGSLSVVCQHTPEIKSSMFSGAATCALLGYDVYQLTEINTLTLQVCPFVNQGHLTLLSRASTFNVCR